MSCKSSLRGWRTGRFVLLIARHSSHVLHLHLNHLLNCVVAQHKYLLGTIDSVSSFLFDPYQLSLHQSLLPLTRLVVLLNLFILYCSILLPTILMWILYLPLRKNIFM
jgi:hypothetical protein